MKKLIFSDDSNWMQAHAHFTVTKSTDQGFELLATGLIDTDQNVRAVAARIIKGQLIQQIQDERKQKSLVTKKYGYRMIAKSVGTLTHVLLLPKAAVDEVLPAEESRIFLLPGEDNLAKVFLQRFASDFNLPMVPEWQEVLWETCQTLNFIHPLEVWTSDAVEQWRGLQAFERSPELTEEKACEILGDLLNTKKIHLPNGVTNAPAIADAVPTDENGKMALTDYLQVYAPHLATTIDGIAKPLHDLDDPIDPAIATMSRVPFPAQAHTAQAILKGLKEQKGVIVSSDMGTGKSIVSLAVSHALAQTSRSGFVTLLLVPGITIPKWIQAEIKKTLPQAHVTVLKDWRTLIQYWRERVQKRKKIAWNFYCYLAILPKWACRKCLP